MSTLEAAAFGEWAARHGKVYAGAEEAAARAAVWEDNRRFVESENAAARAAGRSLRLSLNEFADLTWEEFRAPRLGTSVDPARRGSLPPRARAPRDGPFVPGNVTRPLNWVKRGAVTAVKDQGQCGSCWSFSTTGAIEGANALYYKRHEGTDALEALSEQELVDCDASDSGCNGGLMDYAFKFVVENGGLDTEKDYPYTPVEHRCDSQRENRHVVTIDGYRDVPPGNETALMEAVRHGPVSIAIEADQQGFQFYSEGIFDGACGDNLDHGVLIAGYGRDEATGQSYWLVKNSWGAGWGDHGYIKLAMGIGPSGQCGITSMASYPIKNHPNPPRPPPTPPSPSPPPPPPPPTRCDGFNTCPTGNTCCCVLGLSDRCLFWGCCPLEAAVCCKDHQTCCAEGTVCDPGGPGCLAPRTDLRSSRASTYERDGALFEAGLRMEMAENSRRPSGVAEH